MRSLPYIFCLCVTTALFSQIDAQANSAPKFIQTAEIDGTLNDKIKVKGLYEDTPVGTFLGKLKAVDPDCETCQLKYYIMSQTLNGTIDGSVYLARPLDRETAVLSDGSEGEVLKAEFRAYDATERRVYTKVTIPITILDVNDVTPIFEGIPYATTVSEDAAPGQVVFSGLSAVDKDTNQFAVIELSCYEASGEEAKEACETFRVTTKQAEKDGKLTGGQYTGQIFLKKQLDYETKKQYIMTIMAKDNPALFGRTKTRLSSLTNVLIKVGDKQDSPPEFITSPITITPKENTPKGEVVGAIEAYDTDTGSPRKIQIDIIDSEDPEKMFKLSETKGTSSNIYRANIVVEKNIDYETNSRFKFSVIATELDENGQKTQATATTSVIVDVQDQNDFVPSFEKSSYSISIPESVDETAKNTRVPGLSLLVTDKDSLTNSKFVVELTEQTFDSFYITGSTFIGRAPINLFVKNPQYLDYEVPADRVQNVILTARQIEAENPGVFTTNITITLTDQNDNSPVFSNTPYVTTLGENDPVNTKLSVNVQATDRDSGRNSDITFSLQGTGADTVFRIDPKTGEIFLNEPLNYEAIQQYELLVVATDNGIDKKNTYENLKVDVRNFNDQDPIFNPPDYRTRINEGTRIFIPPVKVQATHPETGLGDAITYRLVAGNTNLPFLIDSKTGLLSLSRPLVYMQDGGGKTIELTVEANDNDPINPRRAQTKIYVTLEDVNDNAPKFTPVKYTRTISEATPKGTEVIVVSATDGDFGSNAKLRYRLSSGSFDHFTTTNFSSGSISVSQSSQLDVDVKKEYTMEIIAIDEGSPPLTGTATVELFLTDANNKDPSFEQQIFLRSVKEGLPIGTSVLTVTGKDPDQGHVLRYNIPEASILARTENGGLLDNVFEFNYKESFTIHNVTGEITTAKVLNRKDAAEYQFSVMVEDINGVGGRQTATTSVLITVLGSSDIPPYYVPPWTPSNPVYLRSIREGVPINNKLHTLIAKDPATNEKITNFEFMGDPDEKYFRLVKDDGDIFIAKEIDYEKLPSPRLSFRVRAIATPSSTGKPRNVVALVNVVVQDVNDNAPVFSDKDGYNFEIPENSEYPSTVGVINANDEDTGRFGKIEYTLSGQGSSDFTVYDNGVIIVAPNVILDHETKQHYTLTVTAKDNPGGDKTEVRRQDTTSVRITITDTNDHKPVFTKSIYEIYTVESIPQGTPIGGVKATDQDSGTNKIVRYTFDRIVDREAIGLFEVGLNDGNIYTRDSLRGASFNSPYTLQIRAQDQGFPVLHSIVQVTIHVTSGQLDDGTPMINRPNIGEIVTSVCENAPGGTFVYDVSATARGENSYVKYSFLTNDATRDYAKFTIKPYTDPTTKRLYGRIEVADNVTLDREVKDNYQVIIIAEDSNNKTLQSFRQLNIRLCDENDNIPSFFCEGKENRYTLEIPENEDADTNRYVYQVKACDDDLPPNNKIEYKLYSDGAGCPAADIATFKINSQDGVIRTKRVLDREIIDEYQLCIRASIPNDQTNQRTDSNIFNLTIKLMDVNDNGPSFKVYYQPGDTQLVTAIYEQPAREEILKLKALDKDQFPYNRPRFLISSIQFFDPNDDEVTNVPGAFSVHSGTGQITVGLQSYKPFTGGYFKINIRGEDYYKPALQESITVTVFITQPRNRIRVVLKKEAENAEQDANTLLDNFNKNSDDSHFILDSITYHRNIESGYDYDRTDICFIILNKPSPTNEYNVLTSFSGTKLVDNKAYQDVIDKVEAVDHGPCDPETTNNFEGWTVLWWVLVAFAIFIFVCTFIFIVVMCQLYRNYKDYMSTRKTYLVQQ